jgi:hypothetical protein
MHVQYAWQCSLPLLDRLKQQLCAVQTGPQGSPGGGGTEVKLS